ncbi:hypothetical protein GXW82_25420 [Streptacidiphilus sp. 4-A2]|nr:hypothetical protein [Streptacidiphilus sp. 4-A2]
MTGISRKLPDTERARLKNILKKIVPDDAGVIVRTAAEVLPGGADPRRPAASAAVGGHPEEGQQRQRATLLYGEPDMTVRVVRDIFNEDFTKVIVSGDTAWRPSTSTWPGSPRTWRRGSSGGPPRWTSSPRTASTSKLMKALDRKVWLPSGGSLVIDRPRP